MLFEFLVYDPTFTGGVRAAAADVNEDGMPDVIAVAGPGGGPHVRVFDGVALQAGQLVELLGLMAYTPAFAGGVYIAAAMGPAATGTVCPPSMVRSEPTCIDKYEASVWETTNAAVIAKIQAGTVTLADLQAAGAVQRGVARRLPAGHLPGHGERLRDALRGVDPGRDAVAVLTWFQAAAWRGTRQAAAVERGVAGGGDGDARPGARQQWHDRLHSGER